MIIDTHIHTRTRPHKGARLATTFNNRDTSGVRGEGVCLSADHDGSAVRRDGVLVCCRVRGGDQGLVQLEF